MSADPLSIWHPFTQEALDPSPIRIDRGEGVYLYARDGRKFIDAISSWWVNLHGHAHPLIAEAIAEQARKLEHVIFAGFSHDAAEELACRLRRVVPPPLEHIFFSDDGSTAVEVALKMALQFWRNIGKTRKTRFVALEHAYHGDTVGAMSVGADSEFVSAFDDLRFPVHRVPSAHCFRCPVGKQRATCDIDCVAPFARLLQERHQEIAAILVEPLLQGAGGMIVHPVEFLQQIRELCTQHDVLLIADEVLTGFGRCGRMFACELAEVVPDIMCVSKGLTGGFLPLAATFCTSAVYETFRSTDRSRTFFHGHSYTANPLGCAAGIASLKIFDLEPVFERIAAIERVHRQKAPAIAAHPAVADVRTIGTVMAIELKTDDAGYFSGLRPALYDFYLSKGVLLRPLGNVVYILPPYVITAEELHYVYDVISRSLEHIPRLAARRVAQ
ncbi:MAG TPA: adenosylmethionine--8-amino-7-oxononanoate transaminase [Candidatus Acidoferrales bacterium]|jgi:adenosylmethionine-8-amino-7-oxononanoate aminotransferase|nr:adenosylmethionine--8-amino-7-oxononanoate transaminase [Candidatus Acidoferrales bacterium]